MEYITLKNNDLTHFKILYNLMVEYITETDLHQNIITPKELIPKITKSMIDKLDENRFLQIVFSEDEPIAFCYAKIDKAGDKGVIRANWGYIMEFFVKKTHRRKGIGKELVNKCESFFQEKRCPKYLVNSRCCYRYPFLVVKQLFRYGRNIHREQSKNINKIFKAVVVRTHRSKIQRGSNLYSLSKQKDTQKGVFFVFRRE